MAARSRPASPFWPLGRRVLGGSGRWVVAGPGVAAWTLGSWPMAAGWGWRVTRTRVTAPSQASRRHASGSSGPAPADLPAHRAGVAQQAVQVHGHLSWGRTPPVWGSRPPSRGGGPARPGRQRCAGRRCGYRGRRPGGPTAPRRPARSGRPRAPTAHRRRPCRRRSGPATTPGGHGGAPGPVGAVRVGDLEQVAQEPPQPTWVQLAGRLDQHRFGLDGHLVGQAVGAGGHHLGVGDRELPVAHGLGGFGQRAAEQGPGGPDRAGWPPGRSGAAGCAARPRSSRPGVRLRPRRRRGRRPRPVP